MEKAPLYYILKGHDNMTNTKTLTAEEKAIRAEKARATRAANKARREARARERDEMLATMKQLVQSPELDANRRADLILEIRSMEGSGYRLGRYYGTPFGMF